MQRLSGQGIAFVEFDGYCKEYDLAAGQSMIVDTGYLAAMDSTCSIKELKIYLLIYFGIYDIYHIYFV